MPRRARIHFVSLRSSLANLPISIYGPLLERSIVSLQPVVHLTHLIPGPAYSQRPQNLAIHLTLPANPRNVPSVKIEAFVGWTGMASASSLAHFNSADAEKGFETIEIDPQYAMGLGFSQGDIVRNASLIRNTKRVGPLSHWSSMFVDFRSKLDSCMTYRWRNQ